MTRPPNRLTAKILPQYRASLLATQDGLCALCKYPIQGDDALDHDHKTGEVRGVLHRGCNAMLGHLENNRARNFLTDPVKFARFLSNISSYLAKRRDDVVLYPTFRTADEKRELRNKRAREARARAKGAK